MAKKTEPDRIEITKAIGVPERILERTIHNPNTADLVDVRRRLYAARVIEISESQEHSPIYEGPEIVVDYVPTGHRRISFVIIEED